MTVSKQSQDPSSTQVDQGKSDPRPGPSSAPSPPRPRYQQVPSHEPMDTTTTQVGPELPPRLRAQHSDISSDPEMEPPRAKSVEKVKKHKDKSKYKSSCYVSSSSEASPHHSKSKKSGRSSPKHLLRWCFGRPNHAGMSLESTQHIYKFLPKRLDMGR